TVLLVSLLLLACKTPTSSHDSHHRFDEPDVWVSRFEDPKRAEWQKPDEVIAALGLQPDSKVADIGSATGYFPVRLAKQVPRGKVYGVDVESSMVEYLNRRAEREGLTNLTSILAAFDDPKLPEPVDVVLIVNTYHHIEGRPAYFAKLAGSVKPGGKLAVIDFTPASKMGPGEKLNSTQIENELKEAGWQLAETRALPEQYFLVFTR
ncbi:MAG TPA: class I SAM-dependent methyltransferase, partial [Archangium sp.]